MTNLPSANIDTSAPILRRLWTARWLKALLITVVVLLPVLMLLLPLRFGHHSSRLADYMPVLSDEIYYWHQALSFNTVGLSSGYYSYAEHSATLGRYYAWGMFVPAFAGSIGRLFGWSLSTIPVMNVLLLSGALAVFIRAIEPDAERLLWLAIVLTTFTPLWLFIVTSMLEVTTYALAALIAAVVYALLTAQEPRRTLGAAALLLVAVAALLRPTLGLFFVPLCLLIQRRNTARSVGLALVIGASFWGVTWLCVWLTAAPFPSPLTLILRASSLREAARLTLENAAFNVRQITGGTSFEVILRLQVLGMLALCVIGLVSRSRRRFNFGLSPAEAGLHAYNLGLPLLLIVLFYNVFDLRDFRSLAAHLLLTLLLLAAYRKRVWLVALIAVGLIALPQVRLTYSTWSADYFQPEQRARYDQLRAQLKDVVVYQPDAPSPWCNTVLHSGHYFFGRARSGGAHAGDSPVLLALDAGIGLSFFLDIREALSPKARYLLFDDELYAQFGRHFHAKPLLDVSGGTLYLNLDSACPRMTHEPLVRSPHARLAPTRRVARGAASESSGRWEAAVVVAVERRTPPWRARRRPGRRTVAAPPGGCLEPDRRGPGGRDARVGRATRTRAARADEPTASGHTAPAEDGLRSTRIGAPPGRLFGLEWAPNGGAPQDMESETSAGVSGQR